MPHIAGLLQLLLRHWSQWFGDTIEKPIPLDVCVLEDRVLYSATMMPVDSFESYDGSVALLERLDAQLEVELGASTLIGQSENSCDVDPFHAIDSEILARIFEPSIAPSPNANEGSELNPGALLEELRTFFTSADANETLNSDSDESPNLAGETGQIVDSPESIYDFSPVDSVDSESADIPLSDKVIVDKVIVEPVSHPIDHYSAKIVLLDSQLDFSEVLESAVAADATLFVYDSTVETASQVLSRVEDWVRATETQISSLSILSHGAAGGFELGIDWITVDTVGEYLAEFNSLAAYFSEDASIYILGCNVVSDSQGQVLLDRLAEATKAEVHASSDITGFGGDWELEAHSYNVVLESTAEFASILDLESLKSTEVTLAWYNSSWNYRQTVTVDDAMVSGTSDLANFTILVNVTQDSLRLTSNGGRVGQADGGDFVFTLADGTTKLSHQIESYNSATGNLVAWVKLPTLAFNADTSLLVYYGNATVANQWNASGTWASDVRANYHLASDFKDSTSNANNATNSGTTAVANAKIAGGDQFNGLSNKLAASDSNSLDITGNLTVSGWFNSSNLSGYKALLAKGTSSTAVNYYVATKGTELQFEFYASGGLRSFATSGAGLTTGTWYNFALTYDDTANTVNFYLNGNQIHSATTTYSLVGNSGALTIGTSPWNEWFNGSIDEIKIEATTKSASWIQTQYLNQNSPGSYVTFSDEQGPPVITSGSNISMLEGMNLVTTLTASDPRLSNPTYSFSIVGGPDAARFAIDSITGELSFVSVPVYLAPADVGADNVYNVTVQVSSGTLWGTQSLTISVNSANDAPTIDTGAVYQFDSLDEDSIEPSGVLVSSILASASYSDADSGALSGIAVTSVSGVGTWQYSTDGVIWTGFGPVLSDNALLLDSSTQIRFLPDGSNGETAKFIYRAWDRTTGVASSNGLPQWVNATLTGGTAAFSDSLATATITVSDLNDAPIITDGYLGSLPSTMANMISTSTTVSQLLIAGGFSDVDHGAISGMAITAMIGLGTWQYSTDGMAWSNFNQVSTNQALLLDSTSQIRYIAPNNVAETAMISYRGWDQTQGTPSTDLATHCADTSSSGFTSAYSVGVATTTLTVIYNNVPPIALTDTATAVEAGGISNLTAGENPTGNVLSNDNDSNYGDQLTVVGVSNGIVPSSFGSVGASVNGQFGALVLQSDGSFNYVLDNDNPEVQGLNGPSQTLTDTFTYTIEDLSEATTSAQIVITIVGTNDSPHELIGSMSVVENALSGTNVGVVSALDVDTDEAFIYSLTDDAGGRFTINADTGVVKVANGLLFDYELVAEHFITVRTIDQGGLVCDQTLSIGLIDVNEAPTAVVDMVQASEAGGQSNSVLGVNPAGNVLANDLDPDVGDSKLVIGVAAGIHASVSGSVNLHVEGVYGTLTIDADGSYNYTVDNESSEVQRLRTAGDSLHDVFTYSIIDASGLTSSAQISIAIRGANDSPTLFAISPFAVDENTPPGVVVGLVVSSDVDGGDSLQFSLTESYAGAFTIDNTGRISVNNSSLLDRESVSVLTLTVRVSDLAGDWVEQTVDVNLIDVDEFDVGTVSDNSTALNSIAENANSGALVGIIAFATDSDATQNLVHYTLDNSADGRFAIDGLTGTVIVANASELDFESANTHTIVVRATSLDGSASTQSFTIVLVNVNDTGEESSPALDGSINLQNELGSPSPLPRSFESLLVSLFEEDNNQFPGNDIGEVFATAWNWAEPSDNLNQYHLQCVATTMSPVSLAFGQIRDYSTEALWLVETEADKLSDHERVYVGFMDCENLSSLKSLTDILFGTQPNLVLNSELHSSVSPLGAWPDLSWDDLIPLGACTLLVVWSAYVANLGTSLMVSACGGFFIQPPTDEREEKEERQRILRRVDKFH